MTGTVHALLADMAGNTTGLVVLDLGAGRVGTLPCLPTLSATRLALAIDIDLESLRSREELAARAVADLSASLPIASASVDVALSHNTLECLAQPQAFLRECYRILKPGGRLLLAHTEFASIAIAANDSTLWRRIVEAYCELPVLYSFMQQADSEMGRKLPGLVRKVGFTLGEIVPHVRVETALQGDALARVEEMAWSVRRASAAGRTPLTEADVQCWLDDLAQLDATDSFFFSETAYAVEGRKGE